jgi:hypothetical protein
MGARLRRLKRRIRRRIPRRLRSVEREQFEQLAWVVVALVLGTALVAGVVYLAIHPDVLVPGADR